MDEKYLRAMFVLNQVSAEMLAVKVVAGAKGKHNNNKKHAPNPEDLARKYINLYDKVMPIINEIDNEE
jgi:hypothetical protein